MVADELRRQGWVVLARQIRVGRDELDIVALDPGPPAMVVVVEVRSRRSSRFGTQEERLDEAKVRRLYRAMHVLRAQGRLPDGRVLPANRGWRVDLVALDRGVGRLRHLKGLIPR
jgi:putative endonuclease